LRVEGGHYVQAHSNLEAKLVEALVNVCIVVGGSSWPILRRLNTGRLKGRELVEEPLQRFKRCAKRAPTPNYFKLDSMKAGIRPPIKARTMGWPASPSRGDMLGRSGERQNPLFGNVDHHSPRSSLQ
jgi:hypothetical protein